MLMWIIALFILNSAHIKATKTSQFSIKSGSDKHARFDREVLLTDENTEEDVLNLPPEIQKERLKKLVKKGIDTNHDGYGCKLRKTDSCLERKVTSLCNNILYVFLITCQTRLFFYWFFPYFYCIFYYI